MENNEQELNGLTQEQAVQLYKKGSAQIGLPPVEAMKAIEQLANKMAGSIFFPSKLGKNPQNLFAVMLICHRWGLDPILGPQKFFIDERGELGMQGHNLLAVLRHHGVKITFTEESDTKVMLHGVRLDGEEADAWFTIEEAQRAGLLGKDNWKRYPRRMLMWRAVSELWEKLGADLTGTQLYTPDEMKNPLQLGVPDPEPAEATTEEPLHIGTTEAPPATAEVTAPQPESPPAQPEPEPPVERQGPPVVEMPSPPVTAQEDPPHEVIEPEPAGVPDPEPPPSPEPTAEAEPAPEAPDEPEPPVAEPVPKTPTEPEPPVSEPAPEAPTEPKATPAEEGGVSEHASPIPEMQRPSHVAAEPKHLAKRLEDEITTLLPGAKNAKTTKAKAFVKGFLEIDPKATVDLPADDWVAPLKAMLATLKSMKTATGVRNWRELGEQAAAAARAKEEETGLEAWYPTDWSMPTQMAARDARQFLKQAPEEFIEYAEHLELPQLHDEDALAFWGFAQMTNEAFRLLDYAREKKLSVASAATTIEGMIDGKVTAKSIEAALIKATEPKPEAVPAPAVGDLPFS